MAKVIRTIDEMIKNILEEVDGQDNFGEIANILDYVNSDVITKEENRYQTIYEALKEIGEDRIADKYLKPLINL
ncbi:hypothetical protein [uncultured Anaerococcus sp.]|uniref:hypothetical protein n=1 Tax=uncultured Anaerococcus sp. TaxID=293428 RepID=UPI00288B703C|nr:hypothetical protein [uncultured Anaerococcus sp.]